MSVTSEQKLVTMAENYYLDLRGSFDESIDKVALGVSGVSMGVIFLQPTSHCETFTWNCDNN